MRITLIGPRRKTVLYSDDTENLGVGYLAAYLRQDGHEVEIVDAELEGLSDDQTVARVAATQPELVGISILFQLVAEQPLRLAQKLRDGGVAAHLTCGGHFPTFAFEQILTEYPAFDSITRGEGEETFAELAASLQAGEDWRAVPGLAYRSADGVQANDCRPLIADLDSLPWPARDSLPRVLANGGKPCLSTSRGCYGSCTFCSIQSFYGLSRGKTWRARSPESVVAELEKVTTDFQAHDFWVVDDTFVGPGRLGKERAAAIAELILARGLKVAMRVSSRADEVDEELFSLLKRAGVVQVFLGLEAGTDYSLEVFHKMTTPAQNEAAVATLRRVGLDFDIGFIPLHPYSTLEDLLANLDFLKRIDYPLSKVPVAPTDLMPRLQVLVGTPIAVRLAAEGRLKGNYLDYSYDFADPGLRVWYTAGKVARTGLMPAIQFFRRWRARGLTQAIRDRA